MDFYKRPSEKMKIEDKPQHKSFKWIKTSLLLLILLVCVVYPMLKIRWAHNQIESFCMEVAIGAPINELEEKARERGLNVLKFKADNSYPAKITVWDGWAFARWFCEIEHIKGKVVSKKSFFLD